MKTLFFATHPGIKARLRSMLTVLWLGVLLAIPGRSAWASEWEIGQRTYFQNTGSGLVLGNAVPGWRIRIQRHSPDGGYAYGLIFGNGFSKCGWVRTSALGRRLNYNTYRDCGDAVGDVGNAFNSYSGSGVQDGSYARSTPTSQNPGCVGFLNISGSGSGGPVGSPVPISSSLFYRYTTNDGRWALVRDGAPSVPGHNWLFVPASCVQRPTSTYPEFYVDFVLWSHANGKFVAAEYGGGTYLIANRDQVGPWERFRLSGQLTHGETVSLRAHNGQFVAAEYGGGGPVNANRAVAAQWETFTPIKLNNNGTPVIGHGDWFALRTYNKTHFLCAEFYGHSPINATRTSINQWESFTALFVSRGYP